MELRNIKKSDVLKRYGYYPLNAYHSECCCEEAKCVYDMLRYGATCNHLIRRIYLFCRSGQLEDESDFAKIKISS